MFGTRQYEQAGEYGSSVIAGRVKEMEWRARFAGSKLRPSTSLCRSSVLQDLAVNLTII